jgi:hypothetical protein
MLIGLFGVYFLICILCLIAGESMPFLDKPKPIIQFVIISAEVLAVYIGWAYADMTDPEKDWNKLKNKTKI